MFGKMLAFVFSFFAVILVIPLIVAMAVLVFKFNLRSFMDLHPLWSAIMLAGYAFLWVITFFALQDYFLVWKPDPTVTPIDKKELIDKLENNFKRNFDGKPLFDVFRSDDNRLAITWSSSINYFQITSGGRIGKKRVVVLTFDEKKHLAYFLMKEKDWRWSVSTSRFDFSMSYSAGIFAEISTDIVPSVTVDKDGNFSIDLKKLSYDYKDLWKPVENAVLASGWTIRGGIMPGWVGRLATAIALALLMFGLIYPLLKYSPGVPAVSKSTESLQKVQTVDREAYKKNEAEEIIRAGRLRSAKDLELTLDGLMKIPENYFSDYEHAFVAYAKVYREKEDANQDIISKLAAFEKERGIKQ